MTTFLRSIAIRMVAIVGTAALVTSGSLIAPSLPAAEAAQSPSLEAKVVAYKTNALRASLGKSKLKRNTKLDAVALKWAKHLATSNKFYHNPNFHRQIPSGWYVAGENIALAFKGGRQLYQLWRNSPGHYQNMIRWNYTHIGVGVYKKGSAYYGVQVFGGYRKAPSGSYTISKPSVSSNSSSTTGSFKVGKTVRAKTSTSKWGPYGTKVSYQWYANGKKIKGATKSTYKIPKSVGGKKLQVKITGRNPDAKTKTVTVKAKVVKRLSMATKAVKVTGTAKTGKTLKATTSKWSPKGVKYAYQWYVNGKKIKGATKYKYKVAKNHKGKKITVTMRGTKTGYYPATRKSPAVRIR